MTLNRDAIAALAFLAFSIAYGLQASRIEMFPGQEFEPFTPRTFPFALAVIGGVLSCLQLLKSLREGVSETRSWATFDWARVALLTVLMVIYAALFSMLGFIVATTLFLAAGYIVLGERRPVVILAASLVLVLAFWAIMTQLLGLYLAPGTLFRDLLG